MDFGQGDGPVEGYLISETQLILSGSSPGLFQTIQLNVGTGADFYYQSVC